MLFSILLLAMTAVAAPLTTRETQQSDDCGAGISMTLFATHYSGTVSTLTLTTNEEGAYSLTKTASAQACGESPSWLTYDGPDSTLYCSDEAGSLSSFKIDAPGNISRSVDVPTLGADVYSSLYGGSEGRSFIAIAHYNGNISTYALPLESGAVPLQKISYSQGTSNVHQTILDPSGNFLLAPDLGGDAIHVFSIDNSSGKLSPQADLVLDPGNGPRHVVFKVISNQTYMYLANELSNQITSFKVDYAHNQSSLSFDEIGSTSTFPQTTPPNTAVSEIRVVDNWLYVANRNTSTNPTDDTITVFTIDPTSGVPSYLEQTSTYGSYPRTFVVSEDKTLVAVGNQKSSTVVIIERDLESGRLGDKLASITIAGGQGLSSVVFAE